jgi:hypothetical protein
MRTATSHVIFAYKRDAAFSELFEANRRGVGFRLTCSVCCARGRGRWLLVVVPGLSYSFLLTHWMLPHLFYGLLARRYLVGLWAGAARWVWCFQ